VFLEQGLPFSGDFRKRLSGRKHLADRKKIMLETLPAEEIHQASGFL
jgi:hypothetical protein